VAVKNSSLAHPGIKVANGRYVYAAKCVRLSEFGSMTHYPNRKTPSNLSRDFEKNLKLLHLKDLLIFMFYF
jgi:hypothetical protein